jgi:hypothetical protein
MLSCQAGGADDAKEKTYETFQAWGSRRVRSLLGLRIGKHGTESIIAGTSSEFLLRRLTPLDQPADTFRK